MPDFIVNPIFGIRVYPLSIWMEVGRVFLHDFRERVLGWFIVCVQIRMQTWQTNKRRTTRYELFESGFGVIDRCWWRQSFTVRDGQVLAEGARCKFELRDCVSMVSVGVARE